MSLAITVGFLADLITTDPEGSEFALQMFSTINQALEENGVSLHDEPRSLPPFSSRSISDCFPYSHIHHLRRFYAKKRANPDWTPTRVPDDEDPAEDDDLIDEIAMCESHLLCHSDSEGCYVPIEFADPLISDTVEIPGGLIGSSQKLLEELIFIAPELGIELAHGELSDEMASRIKTSVESLEPFFIEKTVWLSLYESCRWSISSGSAIVFN